MEMKVKDLYLEDRVEGRGLTVAQKDAYMDIKKSINQFLVGNGKNKGGEPNGRYASFDFCYNYFYSFYKENKLSELANKDKLQMSCLQIGFYLASWGMMRGSSFGMKIYTRATSDICSHANYTTAPTDVVIGNSG